MDQNSAHPSFSMDYTQLRRPHNGGKSVLSPNAPEFVPKVKQANNIAALQDGFNSLSINSSINAQHQQQQQQQQQSHHQQHQFHSHSNLQQQQNCISSHQHYNQNQYYYQQNTNNKYLPSSTSITSSVQDRLKVHHHHNQHHHHQQQQQQYNNMQQQQQQIQNNKSVSSSLQNRFKYSSSASSNSHQKSATEHKHLQQQQKYYNHQQSQGGSVSSSSSSQSVGNNCETSQNSLQEQGEDETFAISYITEIVECLCSDPGSFDSIAPRALAIFHGFGENQYVLSNAMEIIFMQSIEEQNFRYMGAKLYGLLDSINPKKDSVFRNFLNLKLTYHRSEIINYMQNENSKVRGTTLFLAELYMQLRNNGSRMPEIAQNIIFTMNQLLQKHTPENIKCICLTLKLAGYDLEIDCRDELNNIIESLRQLKMDVSTSRLLEATLTLHKNNWGRNETINQVSYSTPTIRYSNEPVFYGPDGQVLTEEENSFLEANIPSDIINDDDDPDLDELDLDTGMDPEMEKDYNEFLKNTMNHS